MKKETLEKRMEEIDSLPITHDFMFKAVFSQPDIARPLIEAVTHDKVGDLQNIVPEKTMNPSFTSASGRFDIWMANAKNIYDLEMQTGHFKDLVPRSEYYVGLSTTEANKDTKDFTKSKHHWQIFICTEDIFGYDERIYFLPRVLEGHPEKEIDSHSHIVFINIKGTKISLGKDIDGLLRYMDKKENPTQNEYVETVDTALALAKQNPLVRRSYMEYRQMIEDEREEAKQEGINLGRKEGIEMGEARLICQLANSMSTEEIAEKLSMDIQDVQSAIAYGKAESTGTEVIHGVQTDDRG